VHEHPDHSAFVGSRDDARRRACGWDFYDRSGWDHHRIFLVFVHSDDIPQEPILHGHSARQSRPGAIAGFLRREFKSVVHSGGSTAVANLMPVEGPAHAAVMLSRQPGSTLELRFTVARENPQLYPLPLRAKLRLVVPSMPLTDVEYEDAYAEALLCLADDGHAVSRPVFTRGTRN
jgi:hypothetical protein